MPDTALFHSVRSAPGRLLDRRAYHADAAAVRADPGIGGDSWKLERSQVFREDGDPAWDAFLAGDWARVTEIFESERPALERQRRRYAEQGVNLRRVRIVETPMTPYLRWEMLSHRVFVESGYEIGVLDAEQVREFEREAPLPELVVYGGKVVYHVRYDERWTPVGAKRVDDPEIARALSEHIADFHRRSEPLLEFYRREVHPHIPPAGRPERIRSAVSG